MAAIEGHAVAGGLNQPLGDSESYRKRLNREYFIVAGRSSVDGGTIRLARQIDRAGSRSNTDWTRGQRSGSTQHRSGQSPRKSGYGFGSFSIGRRNKRVSSVVHETTGKSLRTVESDVDEALINETKLGLEVIRSGETAAGAKRFVSGKGRHGSFEDI